MQTVRLRDRAKVTKLNIPNHKVEAIKDIQATVFGKKAQSRSLKDLLGHSLCCLCITGVPTLKLEYDLGGFTKFEMYCDSCISKCYGRDEPEDKDELAEKYGCIAVPSEEQPRTPREL
jgi:hypothetical protein